MAIHMQHSGECREKCGMQALRQSRALQGERHAAELQTAHCPGTHLPKLTAWHSSQTQSAWAGSCRGRAYLAAGRAGSSGDADSEQLDNEANVVHQAAALHPR